MAADRTRATLHAEVETMTEQPDGAPQHDAEEDLLAGDPAEPQHGLDVAAFPDETEGDD